MNKQINKEVDKIFKAFNENFFDGKLPQPLWKYNRCKLGSLNPNSVIKHNNEYQHELTLPIEALNNDIDEFAAIILINMIRLYDFIYDKKMFSNNGSYCNKRFKLFAESCGLTCIYDNEIHGFLAKSNPEFAAYCKSYGFTKTWNKRYTYNDGLKSSSSSTIYCPNPDCKVNMRKTGNYSVICGECYKKYGKISYLVKASKNKFYYNKKK